MMRDLYLFKVNKKYSDGFSIVELAVVIAILSTLASISIPSVLKTIKLNRLDEAKIIMDSYASECLQEFRLKKNLAATSPASFSEKKLNALGFKKVSGSNCEKFAIQPSDSSENLLFQMDFRIGSESGDLIKTAVPSTDPSSSNSCELWAGDLCTTNNSQKTYWENKFNIEKNKSTCENNFFNWKDTKPSGSFNRWDDLNNSCTKKTWVHKTYIADTESKFQEIKTNEECSSSKNPFSNYTGEKFIPECQQTYFFYKGIDMGSKDLMEVKLIEDEEVKCKVKRENQRLTASNGKYSGESSSGSCGNSYWICNKKILTTLNQWKESVCYVN